MNRRSFLSSILTACAAPLILPGAGRLWKPNYELWQPKLQPYQAYWLCADYEVAFVVRMKMLEMLLAPPPKWPPNMGQTISAAKGNVRQTTITDAQN